MLETRTITIDNTVAWASVSLSILSVSPEAALRHSDSVDGGTMPSLLRYCRLVAT